LRRFALVNASTVNEAGSLLSENNGKVKILAGGIDLLGEMKKEIHPIYPEVLVNINAIPGMDYIKEEGGKLKIGALTKLSAIAENKTIISKYGALAEAAGKVGSPHLRRMITIGGNICQEVRCWYFRASANYFNCARKGGKACYALIGDERYHSIFGGIRINGTPCATGCPANVEISSYLSKIREGDLVGAAKTLLISNPLPAITGRVCPHSCEKECNRDMLDESISIRAVERYLGDYILDNAREIVEPPETESGKSVAIVGSGPAGLSAAYYLRMSGHRVTIFERMEEAGGMLNYMIPAYRLPKDIVGRVVMMLQGLGIEFRMNVNVGKDTTVDDLKKTFDGIFLAGGAWSQRLVGLKGEELTKSSLDFLSDVRRGNRKGLGKKVVVIGGGNVAIDAAITALRFGAGEVTMACLESREEMPALAWEIEQAVGEGVKLMPSWGPYKVLSSKGKVRGIELVRCTAVFDSEGCFAPTLDDSDRVTVEADQIIMAVGQTTDLSFIINPGWSLNVDRGLIVVDRETQGTNIPGIFAGGEVTSGSSTVIDCAAAGQRAAVAIDLYLKGSGAPAKDRDKHTDLEFNSEYLKKIGRVEMPKLAISERTIDREDALGLSLSEVKTEANRCLNCGCVAVNAGDIAPALVVLRADIVTNKRKIAA